MENTTDREIHIRQRFKTTLQRMWDVWTRPEHIVHWWGPDGFTSTIHEMNLREGGEWRLTLHGPDGTNYPNRSVFKEILPLQKIVSEHFNPHFITSVRFESEGEDTHIDWTMVFDSPEMRDIVVKAHKAEEGQKQNLERLQAYLSGL